MLRQVLDQRAFRHAASGLLALAVAATTGLCERAAAQSLPLIRDTEIETLLSDYARPLFRAANLGGGRVAMRIVRSDVFNAFVLDGRNVFIHTGALTQAETPNQVIGVIAHETGHITGGHMAALRARIKQDQTKLLLVRILGIGAAIATGNPAAMAAADELILRSMLAERRSQEGAADQAGLKLLSATKQSGRGMLETFERFAQQEYISDTYKDPFVRSHPVATDRLNNLRTLVERSPYHANRDDADLQLRHDLMRAKLAGYLEAPAAVMNRYPASDTTLPSRYARAIAKYFAGGTDGLRAALADIDGLIAVRPNYPYFWELKGDLLMRSGFPREAVGNLRKALQLDPDATLIQVQLSTGLLQLNDASVLGEAIALLRKSLVEDENPRAWRALGDAYYRQNNRAEADAAIAQASFLEGDIVRAQSFAKRAKTALKRGTPSWVRMDDIISFKPPA